MLAVAPGPGQVIGYAERYPGGHGRIGQVVHGRPGPVLAHPPAVRPVRIAAVARADVQRQIFRLLGISDEEAKARFGFFLDALQYGTPPHGGIAFGLDRIVAQLCGESSIREVIAFPKTAQAVDLMAGAPSTVDARQLKELHIRTDAPSKSV